MTSRSETAGPVEVAEHAWSSAWSMVLSELEQAVGHRPPLSGSDVAMVRSRLWPTV